MRPNKVYCVMVEFSDHTQSFSGTFYDEDEAKKTKSMMEDMFNKKNRNVKVHIYCQAILDA